MTITEVIHELSLLSDEQIDMLPLRQFHALIIARAVLISLDTSMRAMIDAILAIPDAPAH